jgi:ribosomal protein L32
MSEKTKDNPVQRLPDWRLTLPLAQSCPRCGARTRSGGACKSPAMPNGRCRMHGGKSTGPRTAEGLERMRRAKTRHGKYSKENRRLMQYIRALAAEARKTVREI